MGASARLYFCACYAIAPMLLSAVACRSPASRVTSTSEVDDVCSTGVALSLNRHRGQDLPLMSLALTFDDGPGPRTIELSNWLKAEGVRATFFVNGRQIVDSEVLRALVADGHEIGNHGQEHLDLTTLEPSEIVAELTATDDLIAPHLAPHHFFFRPAFGKWDAAVFEALSASPMSKYIGPILWDIGDQMGPAQAADWDCFQTRGRSDPPILDVPTCAELYLGEIREKKRGVILLHDTIFIDDDPDRGGTVDMTKTIVPILKSEGFAFVTVADIPSVAAELPPEPATVTDAGAPPPRDAAPDDRTPTSSSTPPPSVTTEVEASPCP